MDISDSYPAKRSSKADSPSRSTTCSTTGREIDPRLDDAARLEIDQQFALLERMEQGQSPWLACQEFGLPHHLVWWTLREDAAFR
jgi:hypothetical protein